MTLIQIVILLAGMLLAEVLGLWRRPAVRPWLLLVGSVVVLFWLQPASTIRTLGFWLPTATVVLSVGVWVVTTPRSEAMQRETLVALATVGGVLLLLGLNRWVAVDYRLTAGTPPRLWWIALVVLLGLVAAWGAWRLLAGDTRRMRPAAALVVAVLLLVFVVLKTEPLSLLFARGLRTLTGQTPALAQVIDVRWLGYSYVAFRLLQVLRDFQLGRLRPMALRDHLVFTLFFPAIVAGPIDRSERFAKDLAAPLAPFGERAAEGGVRLVQGLFKKFVVADLLALIALNATNAAQVEGALWQWVLLYAFAFQIYFDFSGYTDFAIGLGLLLGVRLPENFEAPYLKPNLTTFWNSWHMTLAQWFRAYFFNPVTRAMRQQKRYPTAVIILVGQLGTMLLIGLWHGITLNFFIWGLWHGVGLFIHNRWLDQTRKRLGWLNERPWLARLSYGLSVLITFHFVALGWVWFVLPDPASAWAVLLRLSGA